VPSVLTITTSYPSPRSEIAGVFVRDHVAAAPPGWGRYVLHLERSPGLRRLVIEDDADDAARIVRVRFPERPTLLSQAALVAAGLVGDRAVRRRGFAANLVHAHFLTGAVPAAAIAALHRLPFVVMEHWSVFLDDDPDELTPTMLRAARLTFPRARTVMAASDALARGIEERGIHARLRVLSNPVDIAAFFPPPARPVSMPARLLTVALFYDAKGIDLLLEAVALVRRQRTDFHVDIVGDGELRPAYEALQRRLGLEDAVTFHGIRPKHEIADLMRRADIYVLPSRFDNNPVALLEASVTGLPAVATAVGGVPEIVGGDGILTRPEPSSIAEGIATALERLPDFDRADIAARAAERYGTPAFAAALADVYADALRRR
jgi:glycosyltransferase involved in cell wall biosynthesis